MNVSCPTCGSRLTIDGATVSVGPADRAENRVRRSGTIRLGEAAALSLDDELRDDFTPERGDDVVRVRPPTVAGMIDLPVGVVVSEAWYTIDPVGYLVGVRERTPGSAPWLPEWFTDQPRTVVGRGVVKGDRIVVEWNAGYGP